MGAFCIDADLRVAHVSAGGGGSMSAIDWLLLRDCEAIIVRLECGLTDDDGLTQSDVKLLRELLNQAKRAA